MSTTDALKELQDTPRNVRVKSGTTVGRVIGWLVLICFLGIGWPMGYSAIHRLHVLQSSGKVIQAAMDGARIAHGKSKSYFLTVSFEYGGVSVDEERGVTADTYNLYSTATKLPVTILPTDPNNFEIGQVTDRVIASTQNYWFWILLILSGVIGLLVYAFEYSIREEIKLMTYGEAATGTITRALLQTGRTSSTSIGYRFEGSSGTCESTNSAAGNLTAQYVVGQPLVVLYLRDNERVSKPLPLFQFVELAG